MVDRFERELHEAIDNGDVLSAAVAAVARDGRTIISKAYGNIGVASDKPLRLDTPMWIASSTKLWTAISALQLVAQNRLSLTDPVDEILPELALDKLKILTGFTSDDQETGEPIFASTKTHITLEMLLTHSSGLSYDLFNPKLQRLRTFLKFGPPVDSRVVGEGARLSVLLFEPGTDMEYSIGIDFAGIMVERVSGLSLEAYFSQHIFEPLGMKDSTVDPLTRGDAWLSRLHGRVIRDEQTGKVRAMTADETKFRPFPFAPGYGGGGGAGYSTVDDYIKVLESLLRDDGKLLPNGYVDILTKGRLPEQGRQTFATRTRGELDQTDPHMTAKDWENSQWDCALGGGVRVDACDGLNGKNTMFWGGMLNNAWYLDREAGIAGFYGTWIYPVADLPSFKLFTSFKRAIWQVEHGAK